MHVQTNKHMNAADVVDIPTAAIITVSLRQIISCFAALAGGWSEELIMCVCVRLCAHSHPQLSKCCVHIEFTIFDELGFREAFQMNFKVK